MSTEIPLVDFIAAIPNLTYHTFDPGDGCLSVAIHDEREVAERVVAAFAAEGFVLSKPDTHHVKPPTFGYRGT